MDPSFSNINEVYYDGPMAKDTQITNDPLSPNYYQDPPYQQNPFNYMKPQQLSRQQAYHDYQITNDHRGQYVLKRQDVNTNLISSNER